MFLICNFICQAEIAQAQTFLGAMGLDVQDHVRRVEVNFKEDEITEYEKKFQQVNKSKKGCVSSLDLRNMLKEMGEEVSDEQLHEVIAEVDTNRNSCVELDEFLQVRNTRFMVHIVIHFHPRHR